MTSDEYPAIRHAWSTDVAAEERLFVLCTEDVWREQAARIRSSPLLILTVTAQGVEC